MTEVRVGRNAQTGQLLLTLNGRPQSIGQQGCVPKSVSREHLTLTIHDDNVIILRNLKIENDTYVNGRNVMVKRVKDSDRIELGAEHFCLDWSVVRDLLPKSANIRHLKKVWDNYNQANIEIRQRQKSTGLLTSVPMVFTMLGGLVSGVMKDDNMRIVGFVLTGIALGVMLYGFYRRANDHSIEDTEEVKKLLQRKYVCPQCGRFLGFQDYDILKQNSHCPYCKAKFVR